MSGEDWTIQQDGADFLGQAKRRAEIDNRKPGRVPLREVVGPGIRKEAVRVTDWNNLLATYNGTYASAPGALGAPNTAQAFVGETIMDGVLGGVQRLYPMVPGGRVHYERAFVRNTGDATSLTWGDWVTVDTTPPVYTPPETKGIFVEASNNAGRVANGNVQKDPQQFGSLLPPPFRVSGNGDTDYFERSGLFWLIRKPGVYQIDYRVTDTAVQNRNFQVYLTVRNRSFQGMHSLSSDAINNADGSLSSNFNYLASGTEVIAMNAVDLQTGPVEIGIRAYQFSPATISTLKYLLSLKIARIGGVE